MFNWARRCAKTEAMDKVKKEGVITLMTDVPSLKIELSGHTDNVGGKAANESLSQNRKQKRICKGSTKEN
ncbi:hypothetical protein N9Y89_01480 [bacterium]|nr:hypothetical protein [bacterium]